MKDRLRNLRGNQLSYCNIETFGSLYWSKNHFNKMKREMPLLNEFVIPHYKHVNVPLRPICSGRANTGHQL